ncbi:methanogenesis marker 14 protein [Methanosphaera cuniculi]|uniref:methanogenesis marker 14 protein n=1 Tax=Methanosphaera cuniculi TaxID=1077256 RepID=UPI0026EEACAA|nr:methanogenesis marker 14 protein [Methanosphaera cuniculi]
MTSENIIMPIIKKCDIKDNFYTVLSVELGNTTIKAIIITTNLKTNKNYLINKKVQLTRNIQDAQDNDNIFGKTIWNKPLTYNAIVDTITTIIHECLDEVDMRIDDLDFVVRSTGIIALDTLSEHTGLIIKALSDGCINAGITPNMMKAPFKLDNIPRHLRKYSFFNMVKFDGSVVSVNSDENSGLTSNQMESELITAGIKLASKNSIIDFRNPIVTIDMGTTLAGCVVDNNKPYADVKCNLVGLAGGISDIILRGCDIIDEKSSTIDLKNNENIVQYNIDELHHNTKKLHKHIKICEVPENVDEFGRVAIDKKQYNNTDVKLVGCTIKNEDKLIQTFKDITQNYTIDMINLQIDDMNAYLIKKIVDQIDTLNLLSDNMNIGITGRAGITGHKIKFIDEYLRDFNGDIIFTSDGLALGALMMARCMNSMGSPINPIGGSTGGMCIMQQRIKLQKK